MRRHVDLDAVRLRLRRDRRRSRCRTPSPASETDEQRATSAARRSRRRSSGTRATAGSVKIFGSSAGETLARPAPSSSTGASCVRAVLPQAGSGGRHQRRLDLASATSWDGAASSSAAAPATCGVAIDVPAKTENVEPVVSGGVEERTSSPGAEMSGLSSAAEVGRPGRREARDDPGCVRSGSPRSPLETRNRRLAGRSARGTRGSAGRRGRRSSRREAGAGSGSGSPRRSGCRRG